MEQRIEKPDAALASLGGIYLIRPVFQGPMTEVWRGCDRDHGQRVAVKMPAPHAAEDPYWHASLSAERAVLEALHHPRIIRPLALATVSPGEAQGRGIGFLPAGTPYLVMEWMEGGTLQPLCGWLLWPEVQFLLLQLLEALAYLHEQGYVHLDVKPGNVLLMDNELGAGIKLADFELAQRWAAPLCPPARKRSGTPAYMAPEQILNHRETYGPWTDLYALGCLACCLVTGTPPYGVEPAEASIGHLRGEKCQARPRMKVPVGFPSWLAKILAHDPAKRYQQAGEAALALQRLGQETPEEKRLAARGAGTSRPCGDKAGLT